jgi:spore coat protein A
MVDESERYPLTPFKDRLRLPPVLRPRATTDGSPPTLHVRMVPRRLRLHSELPPSAVWTYAGYLPGPTIEVRRGQHIRVVWVNDLPASRPYPVTAVIAPDPPAGGPPSHIPQNVPGRGDGRINEALASLRPWTVSPTCTEPVFPPSTTAGRRTAR